METRKNDDLWKLAKYLWGINYKTSLHWVWKYVPGDRKNFYYDKAEQLMRRIENGVFY